LANYQAVPPIVIDGARLQTKGNKVNIPGLIIGLVVAQAIIAHQPHHGSAAPLGLEPQDFETGPAFRLSYSVFTNLDASRCP
jgi:hypothetical protein